MLFAFYALPLSGYIQEAERVSLEGGVFSILPPYGWKVLLDYPGASLVIEAPIEGKEYKRTIQVLRFNDPLPIDDLTLEEIEQKIEDHFTSRVYGLKEFVVRDRSFVHLADGGQGILYYTAFDLGGARLMQAHLLVSSAVEHFIVSFTDVIEHFEGEALDHYVTPAWESMVSVKLSSSAPLRHRNLYLWLLLGGLGLVLLLGFSWRQKRAEKKLLASDEDDFDEQDDDEVMDDLDIDVQPSDEHDADNDFDDDNRTAS